MIRRQPTSSFIGLFLRRRHKVFLLSTSSSEELRRHRFDLTYLFILLTFLCGTGSASLPDYNYLRFLL
jgi:hypothetical protein